MKRFIALLAVSTALYPIAAYAEDGPTYRPSIGEDIVVTATRDVPLTLLPRPLLDTPQGITVISSDTIEMQGLNDLRDVLRDDPAVSSHADEDNAQGTNVQIRGFSARNDLYVDGQLDAGRYYRDPFWLQEVDVLTGPSSVLFGRGSTGGAVNQVARKPILDTLLAGTVAGGTEGLARVTGDVNLPFGAADAFRMQIMAHRDGIADRDNVYTRRIGFAPSVSFGIGTPTTFTLSFLHQSEWNRPDYGVPWLDIAGQDESRPAAVRWGNYYGFTSDYAHATADIATATLRHEFSKAAVLTDALRYGDYWDDYRIVEPGVSALISPTTPLSDVSVARTARGGASRETLFDDQLSLSLKFATGGIQHTLIAGGELGWQTGDPTVLSFSGVPSTNLITPDPNQPFAGTAKLKSATRFYADTDAAFIADTMALGSGFELSGAARYDRFAAVYRQTAPTNVVLSHIDALPSWRAALVYKPTPKLSAYAMWGTSFDPSAENFSLSTATAGIPPERTRTVEGGLKWNPNGTLLLSATVFDTLKYNMREADPTDPSYDIIAGDARARGFSFGWQGRVTKRWLVQGGYMYLDTRIISSPNGDLGARLQNAPTSSFRLFTVYDVTNDLQLGGGLNYSSSRIPASVVDGNGLPQVVLGYVLSSAMARYAVSKRIALQVNVDNLANKRWYDGLDDNHVNPGAGRAARFSLIFNE
jgi:catecholate siderophore receptor